MSEPGFLSVRFFNELSDHLDAVPVLYRESIQGKTDKGAAIAVLLFTLLSTLYSGWQDKYVLLLLLAAGLWFNFVTIAKWRAYWRTHWVPHLRVEYQVTFFPTYIRLQWYDLKKKQEEDQKLFWEQFESVAETPKMFLLLYGMMGERTPRYTIIPKRAFASNAEQNAFRALLTRKIKR